jgi:hypothetical protein
VLNHHARKLHWEVEIYIYIHTFLTSVLEEGELSSACFCHFILRGRCPPHLYSLGGPHTRFVLRSWTQESLHPLARYCAEDKVRMKHVITQSCYRAVCWSETWDLYVTSSYWKCLVVPPQTPWRRVLFDKLTVTQIVKKFSAFYGTRRFITVFTRTHHWSLPWARCIQSIPLPPSLRKIHSNIIIPATPSSRLFRLFDQNFCMQLSSMRGTCPAHIIIFP